MTDVLLVFCNCPTGLEADTLAVSLVERRLAACVNIIPSIRSVYLWRERVETAEEVLLFIKTTAEQFPALRDAIASAHSYDVPEIVAVPISHGLDKYLHWVRESVGSTIES